MNESSLCSLYIEMFFNDMRISTGTGFIVGVNGEPYLITNKHNVTGKSEDTDIIFNERGMVPNKVKIYHHKKDLISKQWIEKFENLYKEMDLLLDSLWIEHPKIKADIIALKLTNIDDIDYAVYQVETMISKVILNPSESVSIIGFPFGRNAGEIKTQFLPIWVNGFLASEPQVNINSLPMFYVDCRARSGQSGSPVIAYRNGICSTKNNNIETLTNHVELLGIYSGRVSEESDIGKVWKLSVIKDLIKHIKGEMK